jgi:hypothetical protein
MVEPADLSLVVGFTADMLPLMAASRLNGSDEEPRDENGGLMRVNGAEPRRFLEMPAIFRGGDRPAGAVSGARGDGLFARAGVRAGSKGGGIDLTGVIEKVKELSLVSLLLFLVGEKSEGSAFSESASSYVEGVYARLPVVLAGEYADNGFPLKGELFARTPSIRSQLLLKCRVMLEAPHTILAIFRRVELLHA